MKWQRVVLLVGFVVGWAVAPVRAEPTAPAVPAAAANPAAPEASAKPAVPACPAVPPGVEYLTQRIGDVPWAIYVVKVDRSRADFRLESTLGGGKCIGRGPVSRQVSEWSAAEGQVLAAVNADFFVMAGAYRGDATGLQIAQGELVSVGGPSAFWVDADGKPRTGPVKPLLRVTWPDGSETPFGLNGARPDDAAVLYTPTLGASTHTTGGRELVLERIGSAPWLPVRPGRVLAARVREVREAGDTPLSRDTLVLSLGPKLLPGVPAVAPGACVWLSFTTEPDLAGVTTAVGGKPVLLAAGRMPDWGKGAQPRHPRTAIGWNDTHLFLIAVDGRQKGLSVGMTFPELASLCQRLGCADALNLDGGGSTTLWLGGRVMNSPSDGQERTVANALLLVRKAPAAAPTP